jgi:hypothetical protein
MDPRERAIDQLERELERDDLTAEDKRAIMRELRDIERDAADEEKWRDEGEYRGWR